MYVARGMLRQLFAELSRASPSKKKYPKKNVDFALLEYIGHPADLGLSENRLVCQHASINLWP